MKIRILLASLFMGLITETGAELHCRGGGLIYDDVLGITWFTDASAGTGSTFDDGGDGSMSWGNAVAWVNGLSYGGFDDWRLPSMDVNGDHMASGSDTNGIVDCSTAAEMECRDNELGYMYYHNLGGMFDDILWGDQGLFTNIRWGHWASTEFAPDPTRAWAFIFYNGDQQTTQKSGLGGNRGAWAVRDGDIIVSLPEIDISPDPMSPIDFGAVTTDEPQQTQIINVTNSGSAVLNVGDVAIAGAADYAITGDTCSNVAVAASGGTCNIIVTFTPTTIGAPSATLTIPSDDCDESLVTHAFSASVAPPNDVNVYTGLVESATGLLASLTPPGTDFSGSISIVPTPGGTSTNTADLAEALLKMIEVTTGSTLFCFNYLVDCEAAELSAPITAITSFDLAFAASGCPANGTIGLRAFSSAFNEEILITLDLSARTFFVEGNTLGTATGTGGLDCADSDYDTIDDSLDNCTLSANVDQRDTNGDGYGNACDPDLDNNGIVNFGDVALWAPFFNSATTGDTDFNGDGFANFGDYALYLNYFLQPPGPSGVAP